MTTIYFIDLFGTFVFAISGILVAVEKKFDLVGASIIGLVTAVGGGTLRDILIGETPVGWMKDLNYLYIVFAALPTCYFFLNRIQKLRRSVFLFDTIGIGLFTILGLQKTLQLELSPVIALLMGVVSAVFGGVIRDVLCNEVPLVFRKNVYATACLVGGTVFLILEKINPGSMMHWLISIGVVILIRVFSVRYDWNIPFNPMQK